MHRSPLRVLLNEKDPTSYAATRRETISRLFGGMLGLGLSLVSLATSDARKQKRKKRKGKKRKANSGTSQNTPSGNGTPTGGSGSNTSPPPPPPPGPGGGTDLDAEESAFLTLINNYRTQRGLGALTHNAQLGQAAETHSQDLADHNRTGHTGSDGSGPRQRIERAGYDWSWWGENVFWGSASAQVAFDWWKESDTHDANMLSANFSEIGIGRAYNAASNFDWYWTTTFGRPG